MLILMGIIGRTAEANLSDYNTALETFEKLCKDY